MGSSPSEPRANVSVEALKDIARDADALLAMLKRANIFVASACLTGDDITRTQAINLVRESAALVRRVEGKR